MSTRFQYLYFSVLPAADWTASIRGTANALYVSIVPTAADAQLRLTPPSADAPSFQAAKWVQLVAESNRKRQRSVYAAACGDFNGYHVEFETETDWLRGWVLYHGEWALDVTYSCGKKARGRDDDIVYEMLASLRVADDGSQ